MRCFACFAAYEEETGILSQVKCKQGKSSRRHCPAGLEPVGIVQILKKQTGRFLGMFYPKQCIHCDRCTYVCHVAKDGKRIVANAIRKRAQNPMEDSFVTSSAFLMAGRFRNDVPPEEKSFVGTALGGNSSWRGVAGGDDGRFGHSRLCS